jgi:hypothetical protein
MPTAIQHAYQATMRRKNVHAFERMFVALRRDFPGKFVAIYDGELVGAYPTQRQAERALAGRSGIVRWVPLPSGADIAAPRGARPIQAQRTVVAPAQHGDGGPARPSPHGGRVWRASEGGVVELPPGMRPRRRRRRTVLVG